MHAEETSHQSLFQVKDLFDRSTVDVGPWSDLQRILQDAVKVEHLGLGVVGVRGEAQLVCAPHHLLEGAEAHLGHEDANLVRDTEKAFVCTFLYISGVTV